MFSACMETCSLAYLNFPSEIQTGCIVFIVISSLSVDCSVTQAYLSIEFFLGNDYEIKFLNMLIEVLEFLQRKQESIMKLIILRLCV